MVLICAQIHHNLKTFLKVLPSLEMSVHVNPCPSRLQEFLVNMDVTNRTSSESFLLNQLSYVGYEWEISSLPPDGVICPSQMLSAGQALSCFFKLKKCNKSTCNGTPPTTLLGSDVRLGPQDSDKALIDISRVPLSDFHLYEKYHQWNSIQGNPSRVDFILISQLKENLLDTFDPPWLFSHHACHRSITSTSPVWWLMEGPRALYHDFSLSSCEIRLLMTIHNSSDAVASVRISTFDPTSSFDLSSDAARASPQSPVSSANQIGWHDVSLVSDVKVKSDVFSTLSVKSSRSSPSPAETSAPYIWSGSSSTSVKLGPLSSTQIPLQVCLFSPGTYNLSNYTLNWKLQLSSENDASNAAEEIKQTSGTSQGHPYYITVLQSP